MSGMLSPILGALVTVLAALAFGLLVFHKLGIALRGLERYTLAFLTGSACLSLVTLLMAALHLARKGAFYALAAALVTLAWRVSSSMPRKRKLAGAFRAATARERLLRVFQCASPVVPPWSFGLFLVLTVPFAVRCLVYAWAPEVSADGSTYHLGNVFRFWAHNGLTPIRDMYGALPEGLVDVIPNGVFHWTPFRGRARTLILSHLPSSTHRFVLFAIRISQGRISGRRAYLRESNDG